MFLLSSVKSGRCLPEELFVLRRDRPSSSGLLCSPSASTLLILGISLLPAVASVALDLVLGRL